MILNLISKDVESLSGDILVTFSKVSSQKDSGVKITTSELNDKFASSISDKIITGKHLECVLFREQSFKNYKNILVIGLGKESEISHESVRQSMAQAYEGVKSSGLKEAVVHFDGINPSKSQHESFIKASAEGFMLASYVFDELKSQTDNDSTKNKKSTTKKSSKDSKEPTIHLAAKSASLKPVSAAFGEGLNIASSVNFSRRLGDMPGNLMTPKILADSVVAAAKGSKLKVTVWNKERIKKEKMGGLLGVSLGSDQEPKFIIMEYKGAAASKKPIVFVGKGLTFDSGGISIKPSAAMEEMKFDMCGGANVIGTMLAISKLKLKVNAIGLVPATENMPGPSANKPGDVLVARNGKSFEVNNTDAEGRLILSDALCYATEQEPAAIFDIATLTGAMVVALGNTHTGYFTRNTQLKKSIESASENSGEWVWNMPLCDFHVKDMKGTFADLSNISSGKGAGSATAAAFLEQFVGEGIPWAHFDIAGTGWGVGSRLNYCTKKGASGVMIRTFVELAKSYCE